MANTLTYKGLIARIDFSAEDGALVGRVAGINDDITFRAASVPELVSAFHEAVDGYLDACAKAGKPPGKTYSGQIAMRIDPAVHAQAARAAELASKSLTQWTEEALRAAANPRPASELQLVAAADVPRKAPKSQSVPPSKTPPSTSKASTATEFLKLMSKKT